MNADQVRERFKVSQELAAAGHAAAAQEVIVGAERLLSRMQPAEDAHEPTGIAGRLAREWNPIEEQK